MYKMAKQIAKATNVLAQTSCTNPFIKSNEDVQDALAGLYPQLFPSIAVVTIAPPRVVVQ